MLSYSSWLTWKMEHKLCHVEEQTSCCGPNFMYWGESAATRAGSHSFMAAWRSFKCPHLGSLRRPKKEIYISFTLNATNISGYNNVMKHCSYFSMQCYWVLQTTSPTIFIYWGIIIITCNIEWTTRCTSEVCSSKILQMHEKLAVT